MFSWILQSVKNFQHAHLHHFQIIYTFLYSNYSNEVHLIGTLCADFYNLLILRRTTLYPNIFKFQIFKVFDRYWRKYKTLNNKYFHSVLYIYSQWTTTANEIFAFLLRQLFVTRVRSLIKNPATLRTTHKSVMYISSFAGLIIKPCLEDNVAIDWTHIV